MAEKSSEAQSLYINALLKHKDVVDEYIESPLDAHYFYPKYRIILEAIAVAHNKGVLLTRKSFIGFINKYLTKKLDIVEQENTFNEVSFLKVNKNDIPDLKDKVIEEYLSRQSVEYIKEFTKLREKNGTSHAIKILANKMATLSDSHSEGAKIIYQDLNEVRDTWWEEFEAIRKGEKEQEEFISTGIKELDSTMGGGGLSAGTLTLFCADVGSFKSTLMLNVAANVWWKAAKNVLFIPLEMPREMMYNKLLSRQLQIPFEYITNPQALSEEQFSAVKKITFEDWPKHESKFFLMENYSERTKVSIIRREIEKHVEIFKPDLIVVDYMANLSPDKTHSQRNDLEIGEMLKDLRHMGRKGVIHENGFAILSGAQVGREALKRVRKSPSDKMMFFSEDIRGSHEYSADSDHMYVLFRDPQQPDERLQLFCVKSRYGQLSFPNGENKAILDVNPKISLIRSSEEFYATHDSSQILQKASEDSDLEFNANVIGGSDGDADDDDDVDVDDFFS